MRSSPLNEIVRADVKDAQDALLNNVVEPWAFFNSHGVKIKKADGSPISYSGLAYTGSPVLVFWDGFIDEHLRKTGRLLIDSTRRKALERNIPVQDALSDCLMHLHSMIDRVFYRMSSIDQHLRGKGYPTSVKRRDVQNRIDRSYNDIKKLVDAEIQCAELLPVADKKLCLLDAVELKPNFFGVGINLNWLIPRVIKKWRENKRIGSVH
jgi:hypothetical protein